MVTKEFEQLCEKEFALKQDKRRVSTTLRQVLTKFSEFFICSIRVSSFHKKFRARIA